MRRLVLSTVLLAACGGGSEGAPDAAVTDADLTVDADVTPDAMTAPPVVPDDRFAVDGLRSWYLVGNALTPGEDRLDLAVTAPPDVSSIVVWLDDEPAGTLAQDGGTFLWTRDLVELAPGEHELVLVADGASTGFAGHTFFRSHPLYVVVATDWDDPNNGDPTLVRQETLHANHPELLVTHFVGPYTFTDISVTAERAQLLADWVTGMRDTHGDEIGLHIHPYCSFVESTSLICRTEPSFAYDDGDGSGYTVFLSAYTEEETLALLEGAKALFVEHGLGSPTSFRAGGWTTDLHTLRALAAAGFVADSSACNWSRMEEWSGYPGASLYPWNQEQWATIGDTSQPYYANEADILSPAAPHIPILELPDNGLLVDYVTGEEMIDLFHLVWGDGGLAEPRVLVIGWHPPNFSDAYLARMETALSHIDGFLHSTDAGPAFYARMSDMAIVWPVP